MRSLRFGRDDKRGIDGKGERKGPSLSFPLKRLDY